MSELFDIVTHALPRSARRSAGSSTARHGVPHRGHGRGRGAGLGRLRLPWDEPIVTLAPQEQ